MSPNNGIVPTMIDDAAKATIKTYPLRRNINMLEGSGGNIGVLTGKNGKLLVDSGFFASPCSSLDYNPAGDDLSVPSRQRTAPRRRRFSRRLLRFVKREGEVEG